VPYREPRTILNYLHPILCSFVPRHNSGTKAEVDAMVAECGFKSLASLIDATVPTAIRRTDGMSMGKYTEGMTESEFIEFFK
jgi:glycine dehydrogenase